jgi:pyruvate dehydrogenase E2 component (dihydrolipoamide acetyltransferase)
MPITIEMPKLSDTMTEGTLVRWIKKVGDTVEVGDVLAEVETDKATMEMEAFDEGTLGEVFVEDGQKVQVGQRLALLLEPGEKPGAKPEQKGKAEATTAEKKAAPKAEVKKAPATAQEPVSEETKPEPVEAGTEEPVETGRLKASPLAKKVAAEMGVDLATVQGSGPGGRIVREDVLAAGKDQQRKTAPAAPKPQPVVAAIEDKRTPLSGMRRTIADRLLQSKLTIPHFYLYAEIDVDRLVHFRQEINAALESSGGSKVTVNDFVLKATAAAATRVPAANAAFAGDAIVQFANVQLACAVAVEEGLVTPVIRQAQTKSLSQISAEIKDLAARARSKKLKPEEYQGGTITVSNLGGYGVEQFFAIINPPQSVIVSVGAIVKKPVVNAQDQIVVGQRMAIGLSCDHRVVDGAIGANFLAELKKLLENPALMLV